MVVLVAGGLGTVPAQPASADACSGIHYCYAYAYWEVDHPSGFRGVKVTLRSNCMIVYSTASFSVEHHVDLRLSRFSSFYIQAGIRIGRAPLDGTYLNNPTRYWAESKPSGYQGHFFGIETLGSARTVSIWLPDGSSDDWDVWFDNVVEHQHSTNNFSGPARFVYAGIKVQDNDADTTRTYGSASRLYFYNLGGGITPRWQGASSSAALYANPGPNHINWADTNWWARMGRNAC